MERWLSSISRSFSFSISSSSSRRRPHSSIIADSSSFSAARSSRGGAAAASELLRFEEDMAEKLEQLCSCVRRSAADKGLEEEEEVDLQEWISDAMAVLMSAHSSAASVFPPAMVSATMADRQKVQEYMDRTIGLLDVCNSLREASYGLDHHLASIVGAAGAFLCSSSNNNSASSPISSSSSSSPCSQTMKAAGRRLAACLAGLDVMEQRAESISCSCTSSSKIMTMMMMMMMMNKQKKKTKPQHIHSPCSSSSSSPSPSPRKRVVSIHTAQTWQAKLQEAHTSLHLLQKHMKSKPLRFEQHIRGGHDRLAVQTMVRALSAINEATVLVLEAAIAMLAMRFGGEGGLATRKPWRRLRRRQRTEVEAHDELEDIGGGLFALSPPISDNRRYLKKKKKGSDDNPWAEPLRQLRQILAGAITSADDKFGSLHSVLRLLHLHLPSILTHSPQNHGHLHNDPSSAAISSTDSTVLIMSHVATLQRQAQKLRPSTAALHSTVGGLSDELTRVRIALLDATSSSTIVCPTYGDLYVDFFD